MKKGMEGGERWEITGIVQGVGFRPWIYGKAVAAGVRGRVCNTGGGVVVEVVGSKEAVEGFGKAVGRVCLPARIDVWVRRELSEEERRVIEREYRGFAIVGSEGQGSGGFPQVSPDLGMCDACRSEIWEEKGRRYRYPFTTCARCGPRYSIMEALPFDRERTTMRRFPLCERCREEYENPGDRRFHAQAMACPECGPQLRWLDGGGRLKAVREAALEKAVEALRAGAIVAVLGVGGFHLMVLAEDAKAVRRLRERKRRPWKPFALMGRRVEDFFGWVESGEVERGLLVSAAAPIVLLPRVDGGREIVGVAEGAPCLGVMLAATPLHDLLLRGVGGVVVATSGNVGDAPICIAEEEGVAKLGGIADFFLSHDREVARRCDDSVVRVIGGKATMIRRSKGYVPAVLPWVAGKCAGGVLGVGGHQKNALGFWRDGKLLLGSHVGDLGNPLGRQAWREQADWLLGVGGGEGVMVATDLHPDYGSSIEAERLGLPRVAVQHHAAHAFAALVESGEAEGCAVVWDGTGWGGDSTVWGGEFFEVNREGECLRRGWLKPFFLPGGERAIREPYRSAAGVVDAVKGGCLECNDAIFAKLGLDEQKTMAVVGLLRQKIGVVTTSAGRLFDAMAVLLGIVSGEVSDAQAATMLEGSAAVWERKRAGKVVASVVLPVKKKEEGWELDWVPAIRLWEEMTGKNAGELAWIWHEALADGIVRMVQKIGTEVVLLTGGCFQNRLLAELTMQKLLAKGLRVYLPQDVPANDGGLAAGQCAAVALHRLFSA